MNLKELKEKVRKQAEPSALKPGDTVDPRTLPVGAEYKTGEFSSSPVFVVVVAGEICRNVATNETMPMRARSGTLVSLPQPIADEVVELGTLAKSDHFEFDEREFNDATKTVSTTLSRALDGGVHTVEKPSSPSDCAVWCTTNGGHFGYDRRRKVRRVPDPNTKTSGFISEEVAADGETITITFDKPVSGPRWQTRDPARIAALEAKLADQVAHGGQDGRSARWLLERAVMLAEEQARSKPALERFSPERQRSLLSGATLEGLDSRVQPGPRLMRHELPSDQKLDRKLTGR